MARAAILARGGGEGGDWEREVFLERVSTASIGQNLTLGEWKRV